VDVAADGGGAAPAALTHDRPLGGALLGGEIDILGWPRLTTPGCHRVVRSSRQMVPAELHGDFQKPYIPTIS